jgi:ubiquinone/menaquinone biosynthesis C-methylase UbiE
VSATPKGQLTAFEEIYRDQTYARWSFHFTYDPLTRFLRDRRLSTALRILGGYWRPPLEWPDLSVLVLCGGVGGEGHLLANAGFRHVMVADFSRQSLEMCRRFDSRLCVAQLDAERLGLADDSFDLVLVQDGLHHLPRPHLGLTEMLRVARGAVVIIEPHTGIVSRLFGQEWEQNDGSVNFVYRWNRSTIEQTVKSFLLRADLDVRTRRIWDHNIMVGRVVGLLPARVRLAAAKLIYGLLHIALPSLGNMMVGAVIWPPTSDGSSVDEHRERHDSPASTDRPARSGQPPVTRRRA